jgi:hypothetical protein
MSQHHSYRGAVAMCVFEGRLLRRALTRPLRPLCPCARGMRAKLGSLANIPTATALPPLKQSASSLDDRYQRLRDAPEPSVG